MSAATRFRERWYVTRHALERWCQRWHPDLDPRIDHARVLAELVALSYEAFDTGHTTSDGKRIFRHAEHPHVMFVVAGGYDGKGLALVTVLECERRPTDGRDCARCAGDGGARSTAHGGVSTMTSENRVSGRPAHLRDADARALRACGAVVWTWERREVTRLAITTGWAGALLADGYDPGDATEQWYDDGGLLVSQDPARRLPWLTTPGARS